MNIGAVGNKYSQNYKAESKNTTKLNDESDFSKILSSKELLHNKIEEMQENIKAGNVDFDPVFQIGGKAYTQEEWDKLLKYVDEVEEETQEAMEIELAKEDTCEEMKRMIKKP